MFLNSCQNLHHSDSWKNDKTKYINNIQLQEHGESSKILYSYQSFANKNVTLPVFLTKLFHFLYNWNIMPIEMLYQDSTMGNSKAKNKQI